MFNNPDIFNYKYAPILSISPAEMNAIEELPDKDKDAILPIFPLRGWVGSQKLENSILRVEKAIGERYWVVDIDASFLQGNKDYELTGDYPREVFREIEALLNANDGYDNWYQYINDFPKAIPTLQLYDLEQLELQINKLASLGRGLVVKFKTEQINAGLMPRVLGALKNLEVEDVFILFDYGQVNNEVLSFSASIVSTIQNVHREIPSALIAISCSSFPSSFSGSRFGEYSIYERLLSNNVFRECAGIRMIYSDRGGARAEKINGGGGIPSPRIDYPLENDWRFIRKEFLDSTAPADNEKEELYTEIAEQIMDTDYWKPDLHVWGTQVIEFTSKGDKFGINSPTRATAVRLNLHMHQQLYYNAPIELMDTDEDWVD